MAFATTGPSELHWINAHQRQQCTPPWAGGASRGTLAVELLRPLLPMGGQRMRSTRPVAPGFEHPRMDSASQITAGRR